MSQRKPLTTLHNGCFARQKVHRTYGKKGKASAALSGTKDFFKMTNELEEKLAAVKIFEENDRDNNENENEDYTQSVRDKKQISVKPRKTNESEARIRVKGKEKALLQDSKTSSLASKASDPGNQASWDRQILTRFVKKYSTHPVASFRVYGETVSREYDIEKIGEGAFSSVFATTHKDIAQLPLKEKLSDPRTVIIKLVPITLPSQGRHPDMTELSALESEVQTLHALDSVHGFVSYRSVLVAKGSWPDNYHDAFRRFKARCPKRAEHKDPEQMFEPTQYYALIDMGYAGVELSIAIKRPSEFQIYDIFWSVCIHLARSEDSVQFEHRDMHVSNICVKPADPSLDRIDVEEATVANMEEKPQFILGMSNIDITIIDYTYSRLMLPSGTDPQRSINFREFSSEDDYNVCVKDFADHKEDRGTRYEDLIQDLTYAKVTKCIEVNFERTSEDHRLSEPSEHYVPQSNVCWLAYLLIVLRSRAGRIARTKYVAESNSVAKEVQNEVREKLWKLQECLFNYDIDEMPKSAKDVVRIGLENGWLSQAEKDAFEEPLK